MEAVGKMLQVGAYEKQFKMVKLILTKLFAVHKSPFILNHGKRMLGIIISRTGINQ